jgi:TrmH family RNA methyltransferase
MHSSTSSSAVSIPSLLGRVRSLQTHRSVRDKTQLCVVEGFRQFIQACDAGFEFDIVIQSPILLRSGLVQKLVRRLAAQGVTRISLTPEQFRSISTTPRASGIAAIIRQRWTLLDNVDARRAIGWVILERIRAPGNLGTILRTAEATGMSGVIFAGEDCDPYHPAVVRASMGGLFHLPLIRTTPRQLSFWLARNRIDAIGLSPRAARSWTELDPGRRYAIVLGEEREGLSLSLRRLCDGEVCLPMSGRADSLNVAIAAGVMMYELVRRYPAREETRVIGSIDRP